MKEICINQETNLPQPRSRLAFWRAQGGSVARLLRWTASALACATIAACAGNGAGGGGTSAMISLPTAVEAPATGTPMSATAMPLQSSGYVEEEYFVQGQANRYRIPDPMKDAQQIDSGNPYVTRALVRRPTDPARFNGTVIVDDQNKYVRDANGQILGGIRTAAQDAPIATNAGIGNGPWFCGPSGNHVDFTPAQLCQHYGSHAAYVARVQAIVNANVRSRVLLPEEAQKTVDEAKALHFSCPN